MAADALPPSAQDLVLDAAQQRALLDGVSNLAGRLPDGRQIAERAAMAAFVFDAMLLDIARRGMRGKQDALLAAPLRKRARGGALSTWPASTRAWEGPVGYGDKRVIRRGFGVALSFAGACSFHRSSPGCGHGG